MSEWQPISKTPENKGVFLVNHQTRFANSEWTNSVIPAYWGGNKWYCYGSDHGLCDYVTHWMTLPEPPK